jgi:Ferritin-like domain
VIAADELAHVKALRATLGNRTAISPAIDISQATFNALYQAAMYSTPPAMPDPFDAFANGVNFLIASFVFEDVGESLCLTLLSSTLCYVQAADIKSLRTHLWSDGRRDRLRRGGRRAELY